LRSNFTSNFLFPIFILNNLDWRRTDIQVTKTVYEILFVDIDAGDI